MVDYASRAAVRQRRREASDVATFVKRLDWVLIGCVGLPKVKRKLARTSSGRAAPVIVTW